MNKLVRYHLYALGFVFSFLLNINSQEDTGYNKKQTFAIIIGVSEYPNLSKSQQLDYADNDAELILDYFINKGNVNQNNIYSFINEKANSKDEIGQELYNILLKEAKPDDLVIIYFGGHGDVDNKVGDGFLLLNTVKPPNEYSYKFNEAIALEDVKDLTQLASNRGVKTLLLTDACRSGIIISDKNNTKQTLTSLTNSWDNSAKLVSCLPTENSFEGNQWGDGHGVFTYFLVNGLKGLADADDNGIVNYKELTRYVEDQVVKETNKQQTPSASSTNPYMPISLVNEDQKKEAELELGNHLNAPGLNKARGLTDHYEGVSPHVKIMLKDYEEQIRNNVIFENDMKDSLIQPFISFKKEYKNLFDEKISAINQTYDGKFIAVGSSDKTIKIIKDTTFNELNTLIGHKLEITSICFSPSGKLLATGSNDRSIIIWDYLQEKPVLKKIKRSDKEGITALKFIDENRIVVGYNNGNLKIWNINEKKSFDCVL